MWPSACAGGRGRRLELREGSQGGGREDLASNNAYIDVVDFSPSLSRNDLEGFARPLSGVHNAR